MSLRMRNPEWSAAIIEGIKSDPEKAFTFLKGIQNNEQEFSSREMPFAVIKLLLKQQEEIKRLKEITRVTSYNATTLKRANRYLSFLETHKPTIDIVIHICQAVKGFVKISWKVIGSIALLIGIYQAGITFEWWPNVLSKQKPPVSKPSQTSQDSTYSLHPYDYNGSRTHLHNPEDILQKRGDRYPKSHVSK